MYRNVNVEKGIAGGEKRKITKYYICCKNVNIFT